MVRRPNRFTPPNEALQAMPGCVLPEFVAQRPGAPELGCWASMRILSLIAVSALAGCCSKEPSLKTVPWSYVSDARDLPIEFSLEEILTRTWVEPPSQTVSLLNREVFQISAPEALEVMAATFGATNSHRAVCIDFYAVQSTLYGKTYYLLCHDRRCPAYDTKISYEAQDKRDFFTIRGQDQVPGSSERSGRQYYYELNPKWQMVQGLSEFAFPPSR
jgi:hypothetical protein